MLHSFFKPLWPKTTQHWLHKPRFIMRGVSLGVAFWLLLISMYTITSLDYHLPSFQPPHYSFRGPIPQTSSLCLKFLCHALHSVGTTSSSEYAPLAARSSTAIGPDGNGFRDGLRRQLIADGARVNMIGSKKTGAMIDNDVILSRQQIIQRCWLSILEWRMARLRYCPDVPHSRLLHPFSTQRRPTTRRFEWHDSRRCCCYFHCPSSISYHHW